jgi:hypothetical protein
MLFKNNINFFNKEFQLLESLPIKNERLFIFPPFYLEQSSFACMEQGVFNKEGLMIFHYFSF